MRGEGVTDGCAWGTGGRRLGLEEGGECSRQSFFRCSDHQTQTMTATWPFACTERRQPQLGVRRPGVALRFPTRHKAECIS